MPWAGPRGHQRKGLPDSENDALHIEAHGLVVMGLREIEDLGVFNEARIGEHDVD
jgi:hypothetical protein